MTPPDDTSTPAPHRETEGRPRVAELEVSSAPSFCWGFEAAPFAIDVKNLALPELARAEALDRLVATVDLHDTSGNFVRRLATRPMPRAVGVGNGHTFEAELDIKAFAGDYALQLGLYRLGENGAAPQALSVASTPHRVRVKNTIFEAFVELINACNFRCTFCPQTTLKRKQRPMDFDLAVKLVRDLADMGHHHPIRLHLLGEPLLYPRFFDFIDAVHEHGQTACLATNGSRFEQKNVEGIFRTRLDEMIISLNTPEEELYNAQRGTSVPYEKYIEGVEIMVSEVVRRGPPPKTRVNVLYDGSRSDHPEELARVRKICNEWIDVVRKVSGRDLPRAEDVIHLDRDATTLMDLYEGLELQWTAYHNWGEGTPPREHFCSFPWRQLATLVDGQTTACCVDAEGEISLGDARVLSLEEIWNGPALNRMREGFLAKTAVEPRCIRCDIRHDMAEFFPTLASPEAAAG